MDAAELKIKITSDVNQAIKGMQQVQGQLNTTSNTYIDAGGKIKATGEQIIQSTKKTGDGFSFLKHGANDAARELTGFAGPAALVAGSLLAIGVAIYEHSQKLSIEAQAQREMNVAFAEASSSIAGEIASLQSLVSIAKNTSLSYAARTQAIKELNKEYPELHGNVNLENINTRTVTNAINGQIDAIKRRSQAKALEKLIDDETGKVEKARALGIEGQKNGFQKFLGGLDKTLGAPGLFRTDEDAFGSLNETISTGTKLIDEYSKKLLDIKTQQANNGELFTAKPLKTKVSSTKEPETILDVIGKLNREIDFLNTKEIAFKTDEAKAKVNAIEHTIEKLFQKFHLTATNPVILNLIARVSEVNLSERMKAIFKNKEIPPIPLPFEILFENNPANEKTLEIQRKLFESTFERLKPKTDKGDTAGAFAGQFLGDANELYQRAYLVGKGVKKAFVDGLSGDKLKSLYEQTKDELKQLQKDLNKIISSTIASGISGAVESIAEGGDVFGGFLAVVGEGLKSLGKAMIEYGIAKKILQSLDISPVQAIAAGIGLEIIGAALIKSVHRSIVPHAEGGVFTVPTLLGNHLFGEAGPEAVVPLNRFKEFQGGGSQPIHVTVAGSFRSAGSELLYVIDKATARRGRNG